jgi:two-component system OmpR family sensor kinase
VAGAEAATTTRAARAAAEGTTISLLSGARVRILAGIVVLLVMSEVVSIVVERQILRARASERVDRDLTREVEELRRLVAEGIDPNTGRPFGGDVQAIFNVALQRNVPSQREAIFTYLGTAPYRSSVGNPDDRRLVTELRALGAVREPRRGEVQTSRTRVRYIAVPVSVGGRRRGAMVVTSDLGAEQAEVDDLIRITGAVTLAVLLLAIGVAWIVAGRVLAPLRSLTDTARSITESDLTRRLEVHGDDEIAELTRTFNAMLDRLESAFASQRAFVSDAGHELRTPITIIRGHLELLGDDPQERRETVELVSDELDRMSRFVEDLLTLAKAERSDFLRLEEVDLDLLTEELMAKASALAPRDWQLERLGAGTLRADRQRLTQAVMSLAHNAVQHTAEGAHIGLGSELEGGRARLWVRDDGPGIALADQERIFDRFAQAEVGRHDGTGLGLAIVRAIAEAHGGRVDLRSAPGEGSTFTLDLPTEPPEELDAP